MSGADVPAAMANPVYVHRKVLHASLSGVAAGTLVDISYTIEERAPYRPGDFFQSWSVNTGTTVRRSRLLIDVPKDLSAEQADAVEALAKALDGGDPRAGLFEASASSQEAS